MLRQNRNSGVTLKILMSQFFGRKLARKIIKNGSIKSPFLTLKEVFLTPDKVRYF